MDKGVATAPRVDVHARAIDLVRSGSLAFDLGLVSAVALVLGLVRLGTASIWIDESFTARAVHYSILEYRNEYHGLYYTLLKPWIAVAGTSEWALRFPSVVGAIVASALLVVIARRFFDRGAALVAGLLLAGSPFIVKWSQQARGYTLALAIALLATLLLLRALERGSRWSWIVYGLAFAALVIWHPVSGVLLGPAHAVLTMSRRGRVLPHGLLAAILIAAIAVPWAAIVAMRSTGEGVAMNWLRFPSVERATWAVIDVSGAVGVGLLLAGAGLMLLLRTKRAPLALWLGTWALAPFLLALAVSIGRPIYLDRYLIVATPAFALLAGLALTSFAPRLRTIGAVATVVMTCAGLALWYAESDEGANWRGEDWRSAVAMVHDRQSDADALVVVPWSMRAAPAYYGASADGTAALYDVWVLVWSEEGHDLPLDVRRALGFGDHRLAERRQFGWRVSAQLWKHEP